ncbi:uncharacterized protein LOC125677739 isoform X2 [Ostrea edulis]|uniref:uncharacterized protein LOC125677739 isoform X2 n=1 Tax=Ostrea edulis TaxID=37623 RepID=UPI002094425A|nr:uncharacterized protein LOC125677739 isoform X2 [Ostrea edulis]
MFRSVFQFVLYLFLVDVSPQGTYAKQVRFADTQGCPSVGLPANGERQNNVLYKTKPMFVLDTRSVKEGYLPGKSYSLYVRAQDSDRKFSDVLVWAEGSGLEGCSTGSFDTNPTYYHQPENCSHLVTRNSKVPEHTFLFTWKAPLCGCVTIRARVSTATADTSSFVLDDMSKKEGHLTSHICPKDVHPLLATLSVTERKDLLCQVIDDITGSDVATRRYVLSRRKMEYNAMSQLQKESWELALHQRVYNIKKCCGLKGTERTDCIGDERRHRLDRFCAYGESIIPFTFKRRGFMEQRRKDCCWKLGERRYHCFAYVPSDEAKSADSLWNVKHVQELDESDPINDLEDYAPEVLKKLSKLPAFVNAYADSANPVISHIEQKDHRKDLKLSKEINDLKEKDSNSLTTTTNPTKISAVQKTTMKPTKDLLQTTTELSPTTDSVTTTETDKKTTLTSEDLQRKMRKLKLRLDCCESGRKTGEDAGGDPWGRCTDGSYKYTRQMRGGRRKCRTYYLKCCIEETESGTFGIIIHEMKSLKQTLDILGFKMQQNFKSNKVSSQHKMKYLLRKAKTSLRISKSILKNSMYNTRDVDILIPDESKFNSDELEITNKVSDIFWLQKLNIDPKSDLDSFNHIPLRLHLKHKPKAMAP